MLYDPQTQTLIRVTMDDLTNAELRELAAMKDASPSGKPVRQVAVVFVSGKAHADRHLEAIMQYGLECRAVISGEERVLYSGTASASPPPTSLWVGGEVLPLLREEGWPDAAAVVSRRLIDSPVAMGPWLTFGVDLGDTIRRVDAKSLGTGTLPSTIAELERHALDNLAKRDFVVESAQTGTCVSVMQEYGSEAILLSHVMSRVQAMVGSSLVVVAVPKEGGFIAADPSKMREVAALATWARKTFDEATGTRRISPRPLLVQEGKVIGFVNTPPRESAKEPEIGKPWWRLW